MDGCRRSGIVCVGWQGCTAMDKHLARSKHKQAAVTTGTMRQMARNQSELEVFWEQHNDRYSVWAAVLCAVLVLGIKYHASLRMLGGMLSFVRYAPCRAWFQAPLPCPCRESVSVNATLTRCMSRRSFRWLGDKLKRLHGFSAAALRLLQQPYDGLLPLRTREACCYGLTHSTAETVNDGGLMHEFLQRDTSVDPRSNACRGQATKTSDSEAVGDEFVVCSSWPLAAKG